MGDLLSWLLAMKTVLEEWRQWVEGFENPFLIIIEPLPL